MPNSAAEESTIMMIQKALAGLSLYKGRIDGLFGDTSRLAIIAILNKSYPSADASKLPGNTYDAKSVFIFIQTAMALAGLYTITIDGVWGKTSQSSFEAFINSYSTPIPTSSQITTLPLGFATVSGEYITEEQLKAMLPQASWNKIPDRLNPLNKAMGIFEINTGLRKAHFMAQILHETSYFKYDEEIASGKAYEGRKDLGNIYPGDGVLFKGRGWLQITGRDNYLKCQTYLREKLEDTTIDITSNVACASQLATNPLYTALATGYFWGFIKPKLNPTADKDDIYWVSVYVNGWAKQVNPYYPDREYEPNHMKERVEMLAITKKAFGLV